MPKDRDQRTKLPGALSVLLKAGAPMLPIHTVADGRCGCGKTGCSRPGKHPATRHGYKDATRDRGVIAGWLSQKTPPNIAVATGRLSGIVILDVDPGRGGRRALRQARAELGRLPKTWTSETGGGGRHYYFAAPGIAVPRDTAGRVFGPGLDVLGEASYAVIPPSTHASGRLYEWAEGRDPCSLKLAVLPAAWLKRLEDRAKGRPTTTVGRDGRKPATGRNTELASVAGALHRGGLSAPSMLAALHAENTNRFADDPLPDDEVERIAASIAKYPRPGDGGGDDPAYQLMTLALASSYDDGRRLMFGQGGFWVFGGTHWERTTEEAVKGRLLELAVARGGCKNLNGLINNAASLLRTAVADPGDRLRLGSEPPLVINCRNGELWIDERGAVRLRPHSPESYLTSCLPIDYDPHAKAPRYERALAGIFQNANQPKRMARFWDELTGYILQPRRDHPMIVILTGGGDNGKTALAQTIIKLMGEQLVHAASRVADLERNRFTIGSLAVKLLFVDDDVQSNTRLPDGILKKISESKTLTGELKFSNPFTFQCNVVPMLICNNPPSIADLSHGLRRRLVVVPFEHRFVAGVDKDPGLFRHIHAEELPGVLVLALKGLRRLRKRGRFKYPADVRRATKRLVQQANPLALFIAEECVEEPKARTPMTAFYARFAVWAAENGITRVLQRNTLKRNLEHLGYYQARTGKARYVTGLRLEARLGG